MTDRGWLAPLTGLAFFVLTVIVFAAVGEPPDVDSAAQDIVDFYVDNEGQQVTAGVLEGIAATLFVFFGAVVLREIRAAEGERPILGYVALAGTVVFAVGLAIDATITFALAETAEDIEPAAVQALSALWQNDYVPFAVGMQIFLLGAGIGIVRYAVLPKWVGWVAVVLAVLALSPIGFVAFLGSGLLIAVMSVMLAVRAKARQRLAMPVPPAPPAPPVPPAPPAPPAAV